MKPIEFYTTPEGEVTMRPLGEAERQLRESDTEFIQAFLEILREFYTEAYTALMEIYSKSSENKRYRDFLAVRRFIKCNFGLYDNVIDTLKNSIREKGAKKIRYIIRKSKCSRISKRKVHFTKRNV